MRKYYSQIRSEVYDMSNQERGRSSQFLPGKLSMKLNRIDWTAAGIFQDAGILVFFEASYLV